MTNLLHQEDQCFFILLPTLLVTNQPTPLPKFLNYSIAVFKGTLKLDEITIIPTQEYTGTQTLLWLNEGRLEFPYSPILAEQELIRVEIHEWQTLTGLFYIDCSEYANQLFEKSHNFFREKVRINEYLELQFDIFTGKTAEEVDCLMLDSYGEPTLRTPFTKRSRDVVNDEDLSLKNFKFTESQIIGLQPTSSKLSRFQGIDEQDSFKQSVPNTPIERVSRESRYSFKIDLQEVPSKELKDLKCSRITQNQDKKPSVPPMSLKEKALISLFWLTSCILIYFAMQPSKKV